MADKKGRVQAVIQKDLSEIILYELKSPVTKFASVNEVKMTIDYSYCKVYVSDINPDKTDEVVRYLNNNKGKIRTMLSKKLSIYKTPDLIFLSDKTYEESTEMEKFIEMANNKKPVTLKDVFGDDFKMADETEEKENDDPLALEVEIEKPVKKTAKKKTAAEKTTAKKTTTTTATKRKTTKKSAKTAEDK